MYDSLIFAPPRWSFKSSPELSNEEEDGPRKKRSLLFENLLSGIAWLLNNGGGYSLSPSLLPLLSLFLIVCYSIMVVVVALPCFSMSSALCLSVSLEIYKSS
jgi:hypothetical protein